MLQLTSIRSEQHSDKKQIIPFYGGLLPDKRPIFIARHRFQAKRDFHCFSLFNAAVYMRCFMLPFYVCHFISLCIANILTEWFCSKRKAINYRKLLFLVWILFQMRMFAESLSPSPFLSSSSKFRIEAELWLILRSLQWCVPICLR